MWMPGDSLYPKQPVLNLKPVPTRRVMMAATGDPKAMLQGDLGVYPIKLGAARDI